MATGDISGAAVQSFMLDNNADPGVATELKSYITEIHLGVEQNTENDTRVGDVANRTRTNKPTHSMTISVRPHYSLVDILYGDRAHLEKNVTLQYDVDAPADTGIKVTGKVVIASVPDLGLMASGSTPDVQVTLESSDGAGFTITSDTS